MFFIFFGCEKSMSKKVFTLDLPKWQKMEIATLSVDTLESLSCCDNLVGLYAKKILDSQKTIKNLTAPIFKTRKGKLFKGDCLRVLDSIEDNSIDCIFADPPFNLSKVYDSKMNDSISDIEYLQWTRQWIEKCIPKLKEGGSFFILNLPKWNTFSAQILNKSLVFKHWIVLDIKAGLPIKGRLYPSHYSLLYFVKGSKAKSFTPPRLPIDICFKCGHEIKDYGGYKNKMNPKGISLTDVWNDIPPVRHKKLKNRSANELSLKLLDRVLDIATIEGDVVLDPFAGSGTTLVVSELKKRKWIGIELGSSKIISDRFNKIEDERLNLKKYQLDKNILFTKKALGIRKKNCISNKKYNIINE